MNTARYFVGLILMMSLPPGILLWFAIHPLIHIWRRFGAGWTYAILSPFVLLWMLGVFLLRDELLGADLGTNLLLLIPAGACAVLGAILAWKRRRHLTYKILVGLPEFTPQDSSGRLLTEGLYARIRHPRYVEILLFTAAYAFFANHVGSYVVTVLSIPATYLVVLMEEKELRNRFGIEYEEYCLRVPRFVPRIMRD